MRICSVSMFCEDTNICKRITNEIISTFVSISVSQSNDEIKYVIIFCYLIDTKYLKGNLFVFRNEIISSLNTLCQEHLAFSSKLVFDFLDNMISLSPDIVTCFLPKLLENITTVEWKRGIGSDFTLR